MVGTTTQDATAHCPIADRCAGCGGRIRLTPAIADTPVGTLCLTLCPACIHHRILPTFTARSAVAAVLAHRDHLGIDTPSCPVAASRAHRARRRGAEREAR